LHIHAKLEATIGEVGAGRYSYFFKTVKNTFRKLKRIEIEISDAKQYLQHVWDGHSRFVMDPHALVQRQNFHYYFISNIDETLGHRGKLDIGPGISGYGDMAETWIWEVKAWKTSNQE
jgi:hypothetical protein